MKNSKKQLWAEQLLAPADITINGSRPWDIQVKNPAVYDRVFSLGSLGLGESYMDDWWDCQALDQFFYRLISAKLPDKFNFSLPALALLIKDTLLNLQSLGRSFEVAKKHYDLDNDFFAKMLGESMAYTCGYWKTATNLTESQFAKFDLICKKLHLQAGQKILDIGSGFGSFAKYAAERYGVSVVGITVSVEQLAFAKDFCKGLPVEFRLQDYRNVEGVFDHVVSVGMFEAVGKKNFRTYMEVAHRCLKEDGLFLLHTIGNPDSDNRFDPWMDKYIFPNGYIPSLTQISQSSENLFVIEDVHNFGAYYETTLLEWYKNFKTHWPEFLGKSCYDQKFYRMWEYYLLSCAALFKTRTTQLWQIVLSPHGVSSGYSSVR